MLFSSLLLEFSGLREAQLGMLSFRDFQCVLRTVLVANTAVEQRLLCVLLLQLGIWVLYKQGASCQTRVQYVGLRQKRDFYRTGLRCK